MQFQSETTKNISGIKFGHIELKMMHADAIALTLTHPINSFKQPMDTIFIQQSIWLQNKLR